jgi:outer membrane protein insertion porin family
MEIFNIKDEDIINNINSKSNSLFNRNTLLNDIDTIEMVYLSKGFNNISIKTSTESYSEDRVNLIFDIYEDDPSKIIKIKFKGNKFFSDRFLRSLIKSEEDSFLNFFHLVLI